MHDHIEQEEHKSKRSSVEQTKQNENSGNRSKSDIGGSVNEKTIKDKIQLKLTNSITAATVCCLF